MTDGLYVHLDSITNSVLSKGITNIDFTHSVVERPSNLLLLDPTSVEGEFESHTGLKIVRGREQVEEYFSLIRKKRNLQTKWIDFNDIDFLKQLTPLEISELLYFGHMRTQLHSPFFYKLQNNFVFFEMAEGSTKIYYRHLEEFYRIIGDKITRILLEKLNDRKSFFKRAVAVEYMSDDLIKQLKPIFQEGVVLSFSQSELINKTYTIPIYVVEDRVKKLEERSYKEETKIGALVYDANKRNWHLYQEEDEKGLFSKQA